jgi:hypothetical protein
MPAWHEREAGYQWDVLSLSLINATNPAKPRNRSVENFVRSNDWRRRLGIHQPPGLGDGRVECRIQVRVHVPAVIDDAAGPIEVFQPSRQWLFRGRPDGNVTDIANLVGDFELFRVIGRT